MCVATKCSRSQRASSEAALSQFGQTVTGEAVTHTLRPVQSCSDLGNLRRLLEAVDQNTSKGFQFQDDNRKILHKNPLGNFSWGSLQHFFGVGPE